MLSEVSDVHPAGQPWTLTDQAPPPENSPQMSQWQLRQYLNNLNSLAGQSGNGQLPPF